MGDGGGLWTGHSEPCTVRIGGGLGRAREPALCGAGVLPQMMPGPWRTEVRSNLTASSPLHARHVALATQKARSGSPFERGRQRRIPRLTYHKLCVWFTPAPLESTQWRRVRGGCLGSHPTPQICLSSHIVQECVGLPLAAERSASGISGNRKGVCAHSPAGRVKDPVSSVRSLLRLPQNISSRQCAVCGSTNLRSRSGSG